MNNLFWKSGTCRLSLTLLDPYVKITISVVPVEEERWISCTLTDAVREVPSGLALDDVAGIVSALSRREMRDTCKIQIGCPYAKGVRGRWRLMDIARELSADIRNLDSAHAKHAVDIIGPNTEDDK